MPRGLANVSNSPWRDAYVMRFTAGRMRDLHPALFWKRRGEIALVLRGTSPPGRRLSPRLLSLRSPGAFSSLLDSGDPFLRERRIFSRLGIGIGCLPGSSDYREILSHGNQRARTHTRAARRFSTTSLARPIELLLRAFHLFSTFSRRRNATTC